MFAGTHDIAAKFVIEGKADVATVYDTIMSIDSSVIDTNEIRILSVAGVVSQAPILISNTINEADRKKINDIFINAKNYPGGKEFLKKLHEITKVTGFIPATEKEYLE
jgi:ABC-type phosphate/phosphonate transport system substrate-binding protein